MVNVPPMEGQWTPHVKAYVVPRRNELVMGTEYTFPGVLLIPVENNDPPAAVQVAALRE